MIAFLSTWRDMGWPAALLLTAIVAVVLVAIALAILSYLSPEKRWMRSIRRVRRKRQKAFQFLLATAPRDDSPGELPSLLRKQV